MGVAAQVLMEDSGFAVGDLVAGRLLGAGALLLMFEHFFMRRSLLKYFSQPGVAKDILLYGVLVLLTQLTFFPTLAADSGFFHLEARIHRAFQNFKIYVGVATTFVSGKCSFLLKADGLSTRLRTSKLNSADIRSNKPTS